MPIGVLNGDASSTFLRTPSRALQDLINDHYPSHYVARQLRPDESVKIDGNLDDKIWQNIPWLDNFLDLAGPRYSTGNKISWQEASKDYAYRLTGDTNPTRVKVRWDSNFLYIGAQLRSSNNATVTGHCNDLQSNVWRDTPILPYFDDDFEFFVDASQSNYFYVEFEMNARNATYSTLWSLPQAGLGSVAPECGGGDHGRNVCCNSTWNGGKGLCDHDTEKEGNSWTLEEYNVESRPGNGLVSASAKDLNSNIWTLEARFPIMSNMDHGGLINTVEGNYYPGTNPSSLDPNKGRRYWWAAFANTLHPSWWSSLNASSVKKVKEMNTRCQTEVLSDVDRYGFSQFLVDSNNAATTCYYEASSQHLGGHQYMHNPDTFGYLEFVPFDATNFGKCRNVQWLSRFALSQIYQAQIQYLINPRLGNGTYASRLDVLLDSKPPVCTIENACNITSLRQLAHFVHIRMTANETATSGNCVRYAILDRQTSHFTGGPCFNASVSYRIRSKANLSLGEQTIVGNINEARYITSTNYGQNFNSHHSQLLCLDNVMLSPLPWEEKPGKDVGTNV